MVKNLSASYFTLLDFTVFRFEPQRRCLRVGGVFEHTEYLMNFEHSLLSLR
jgi:hypothetical protein